MNKTSYRNKTNSQSRPRTTSVAFGGICLALTLVFLFAGAMIPGVDLTLFAISSLFTAVVLIELGVPWSVAFFAAASVLGLILVPNKLAVLQYVAFFGYYPIAKYFIEKLNKRTAQLIAKICLFAVLLSVLLFGLASLVTDIVSLPNLPYAALLPVGIAFLLLYDYILTLLINLYYSRVKFRSEDKMKLS